MDDADPPDERVTLVGLTVAARPEGETEANKNTVPEKLLRLARLTVEVADEPTGTLKLLGFAVRVKSGVEEDETMVKVTSTT